MSTLENDNDLRESLLRSDTYLEKNEKSSDWTVPLAFIFNLAYLGGLYYFYWYYKHYGLTFDWNPIIVAMLMVFYYISAVLLPSFTSLWNLSTLVELKKTIESGKRLKPVIQLFVENYSFRRFNGKRMRVVSSREEPCFEYASWKDVSDEFVLDNDFILNNNKTVVQVEIKQEIGFADDDTYQRYTKFKDEVKARNKGKDYSMNFEEKRTIEGFDFTYGMICLTEKKPFGLSMFVFWVCVILGLTVIYEIYFRSQTFYLPYKIKKVVTIRPSAIANQN